MASLTWLAGMARRHPWRLAGTMAGVAAVVAFIACLAAFLASARATMTQRAARNVTVDWQVQLQPQATTADVDGIVGGDRSVAETASAAYADSTGFEAATAGSTQTTGPGVVLGLDGSYLQHFRGEIRPLVGAAEGVLLAQQTATNLHAAPGDTVAIGRAGLAPVSVTVDGIVDLPQADTLFQHVGVPAGAAPQAPPDNVVVMPIERWHALFDPLAAARPDLVRSQIHVRLTRPLPADPVAAFDYVSAAAHHIEAATSGSVAIGDNLSAALGAARSDALYAQILFLFLGAPGLAVAIATAIAISAAANAERRREQSLVRARGATRAQLVRIAGVETAAVAVAGAAVGLGVAWLVSRLVIGSSAGIPLAAAAFAAVAGVVTAVAAVLLPAFRDATRVTVIAARRRIRRPAAGRGTAAAAVVCAAAATAVFLLAGRNKYELVFAPEGVPTVSVSYWAFAAPACAWIAFTLVVLASTNWLLGHSKPLIRRILKPAAGGLAGAVAASVSRQRSRIAAVSTLIAVTTAFAISTAVFDATYREQVAVDAHLTNGGDVSVTLHPGADATAVRQALAATGGIRHTETLQHRFAYVGTDLQDLYAVHPASIAQATQLQDAYFQGGTARALLGRLATQPDAVLVSAETVHDFQLNPGDTLNLRLQNARTHHFDPVTFHYAGIVKEFPTAPTDSFLVANRDYITAVTSNADPDDTYLVDLRAPPTATRVAAKLKEQLGSGATVTDVTAARRITGSSLTAVDLAGLDRIQLGFAALLVGVVAGLVLAITLAARRRSLATARALGATRRQIGIFVAADSVMTTVLGVTAGLVCGAVLASLLVTILTGVFDPAPATLAVPWRYLAIVVLVTLASVTAATATTIRSGWNAPITLLRES